MKNLVIRKVAKKELPQVLKLSKEFIEEYRKMTKMKSYVSVNVTLRNKKKIFEKDLKNKKGQIFIAEFNDSLIGYIFVLTFIPMTKEIKNGPGYVSDLHVQKKFRRKGIAKKLISEAEKWLKQKKKDKIILDVNKLNKSAISLYSKLKYKEESIRMTKKLK